MDRWLLQWCLVWGAFSGDGSLLNCRSPAGGSAFKMDWLVTSLVGFMPGIVLHVYGGMRGAFSFPVKLVKPSSPDFGFFTSWPQILVHGRGDKTFSALLVCSGVGGGHSIGGVHVFCNEFFWCFWLFVVSIAAVVVMAICAVLGFAVLGLTI